MRNITPTPWRIIAIEGGMAAIDGANGEDVAGVVSPEDGRLIAAAPDLLESLKALLERYVLAIGNEGIECLNARAAIAKATGEQL